jgi:hypothetical protein
MFESRKMRILKGPSKTHCYLILMFLASVLSLQAQTFEGKITYSVAYESKVPNVSNDQLGMFMGATQEYYIKEGAYKTLSNGQYFQMQLYVNVENRLYNKMAPSDTLYWIDGAFVDAPIKGSKLLEEKVEVMGLKCSILEVTTTTGKTTYYFSEKYEMSPEFYKDHNFGGWNYFVQKTEALPLKIVTEGAEYNTVSIATSVEAMKLNDTFFLLPKGAPFKKQPGF